MARIPLVDLQALTPAQQTVCDAIMSDPNRDHVPAPYRLALHCPEFAGILQQMAGLMRFRTSLPRDISQLAIIITARYWTCEMEWAGHAPRAVKAGVPQAAVDAIRIGQRPVFAQPTQEAAYLYCSELHETKTVSDATHQRALACFGIQGVIELTGVMGYYTTVAMLVKSQNYVLNPDIAPQLAPL